MNAAALLAELAQPRCFPHAPAAVELVQTHLSIVCLAGSLVYKLKKAVALPFVDFSTLAARRQACRDEVRLNRRLCPDVYLGTASLRRGVGGGLRFAATGDDDGPDDLDVAVVMRRLPQARMLDELLRAGSVAAADVETLARHVAAFHARADRGAHVRAAGDPDRLAGFAAANFAELQALPDHGLPALLLQALARASAADFARLLPELRARAAAGRVVDGHGDLHARNICMVEPPAVYDCIEFAAAFRCGDVATECAFLAMDLRYRGAPALAATFVNAYTAASGDAAVPALLPTLCGYRAMVRAKVAALAAAEAELPAVDRERARHSAWRHVLLAAAYAAEQRGPWWLVVCGPPASGKSRLCAALAEAVAWPQVATDRVRKELAGVPPTAPARAEHYAPEFSRRTYAEVVARAAAATRAGERAVLLDGNFPTPDHRAAAATAARAAGARPFVVHVAIDASTAAARAAARTRGAAHVSDAGPEIALQLHAAFVPPEPSESLPMLFADGARASEELAADVLAALLAPGHDPTAAR